LPPALESIAGEAQKTFPQLQQERDKKSSEKGKQ
jgi:hypothetical protein